jgi:hypothetical protein
MLKTPGEQSIPVGLGIQSGTRLHSVLMTTRYRELRASHDAHLSDDETVAKVGTRIVDL